MLFNKKSQQEGGTAYQAGDYEKQGMDVHREMDDDDQVNFVRKVYSILAVQLSITSAFIFVAQS